MYHSVRRFGNIYYGFRRFSVNITQKYIQKPNNQVFIIYKASINLLIILALVRI